MTEHRWHFISRTVKPLLNTLSKVKDFWEVVNYNNKCKCSEKKQGKYNINIKLSLEQKLRL